MKNLEKITENRILLFLTFLVLGAAVFYSTLNGYPVFDDFSFIFNSKQFVEADSPLVFFENRSWPISFSLLWVIYKFAGDSFIAYKAVNLMLHILNAFLVCEVLRRYKFKYFALAGLVFLVHSMQVETISWIFQFKTVVSVTFFLLSYLLFLTSFSFKKVKHYLGFVLSVVMFALSVFSKITAIFMPFIFAYHILKAGAEKRTLRLALLIPFFILSYWSGNSTLIGIKLNNYENVKMEQFENNDEIVESEEIDLEDDISNSGVKVDFDYIDPASFEVSAPYDLNNNIIALFNVGFYFSHFFVGNYNSLVYIKERFSSLETHIYSFLFLLFLSFFFTFAIRNKHGYDGLRFGFYLFLAGIIPVLGFKYVPYMKYSYVADHWAYLGILGLSVILVSIIDISEKVVEVDIYKYLTTAVVIAFVAFQLFRSFVYTRTFSHKYNVLWNAINHNPYEPSLYLTLARYYTEDDDNLSSREMYSKAYGQKNLENDINVLRLVVQHFNQKGEQGETYNVNMFYAIKSAQVQREEEVQRFIDLYSGIGRYKDSALFLKALYSSNVDREELRKSMKELFSQ